MPYITPGQRKLVDDEITALVEAISAAASPTNLDGILNYAVTRLLHDLYPASYFNYNRAMGVIACIKDEYYRRVVAPYEDTKIEANGDV